MNDYSFPTLFTGGKFAIVSLLLSLPQIKASVEAKNKDGLTPRGLAKTTEVAAALVSFAGAPVSAGNYNAADSDED